MSTTSISLPPWALGMTEITSGSQVTVLGTGTAGPHVIRVCGRTSETAGLVMKHYPDGSGLRAATTMRTLAAALSANPGAPLQIPAVVAWHRQRRVLLQEAASGAPLLPLLTSRRRSAGLVAAARALATLHALPVRVGHVTGMRHHLAELIRPHPMQVADAWEALGPGIREVSHALEAWDRDRRQPRPVPIHRDAHPRQMLLDGRGIWLVDWDLAANGDAALDVANFAVYLRTRAGTGGDASAAAFLDAYARAGGDLTDRLPWFTTLTYLRLIAKAYRLRPSGWRQRARTWLQQAERAIARA